MGKAEEMLMSFAELALAVGTDLASCDSLAVQGFYSIAIDSREIKEDGLFVALSGSSVDGHSFIEAAFAKGASGAVCTRSYLESEAGLNAANLAKKHHKALIAVDNTLHALQSAAAAYLAKFPSLLKIGITGSSGKTTCKEIAAAMIGQEKRVVYNQGNYNSETGLPLSVFTVRSWHEVGVFELGMNRSGEIRELARVLKPHIALITNIGSAHIGILGSLEAIAEEKAALFSQFSGTETALIPRAAPFADFLARRVKGRVVFYGNAEESQYIEEIQYRGIEGTQLNWAGKTVLFRLAGRHNLANALAAAAIALAVPVSHEAIRAGLAAAKPLFGRSEILTGSVTIIRDCYNANPDSMREALNFCDSIDWPGRKVYVIGSMLELGALSSGAHEDLGRLLAESQAAKVFLYGAETKPALTILAQAKRIPCFYTDNMNDLKAELAQFVCPGDLVLLKGSRGCALEQLMAAAEGRL
ncbi:UDP-N-acetylmuramoyl-tripeptide--D-alanyl-D-alanine ligase [Breznakiellaceae bacterium SP9]